MAKRTDIKTILILGAGPIVIGQACDLTIQALKHVKRYVKRDIELFW